MTTTQTPAIARSRARRSVPGLLRGVALAAPVLLLAGCGFVSGNTTAGYTTSENAANAVVGPIRVDDAYAQLAGDGVDLHFTLSDQGPAGDVARDVTVTPSPGAAPVTVPLGLSLAAGRTRDLDPGAGAVHVPMTPPPAGSVLAATIHFAGTGGITLDLPVLATAP